MTKNNTPQAISGAVEGFRNAFKHITPVEPEKPPQVISVAPGAMMEMSQVPKRYSHWTLEDFDRSKYQTPRLGGGWFLAGSTGSRKSSYAAAIVHEQFRAGLLDMPGQMEWISCPLFSARVKSCARPGAKETEYDILRGLKEKRLIVIDDLGHEGTHPWEQQIVKNVVWQAYDTNTTMIVTSQKPLDELAEDNDALASRLSSLIYIPSGDKDYRGES